MLSVNKSHSNTQPQVAAYGCTVSCAFWILQVHLCGCATFPRTFLASSGASLYGGLDIHVVTRDRPALAAVQLRPDHCWIPADVATAAATGHLLTAEIVFPAPAPYKIAHSSLPTIHSSNHRAAYHTKFI